MASSKARPFVKWAGGKTQLLPELRKYVPEKFGCYWEPFIGGGALFFELAPKKAVLCDLNHALVAAYAALRDNPAAVIDALKRHKNEKMYFLRTRDCRPDPTDLVETAAWTIYLNKTCFNGLWRENKKGKFNVPFAGNKNPLVHVDEENLWAVSLALQHTETRVTDFRYIQPKRGDFVYFDPPYAPLNATSDFTSYTAEGFGARDQVRLRDFALELKDRGVYVLISNSSAELIRDLYATFEVIEVQAKRSINSKGDKRGAVKELLIR